MERRNIPGFPGYAVDADGRVWTTKSGKWRELKPGRQVGGYRFVGMVVGGKKIYRRVHRLVLEVFIGPCPEGMQSCHRDGNATNNALDNLRWDTPKANQADIARHGRRNCGPRNGQAKLTDEQVRAMRADYANGATRRELAAKYKVGMGNVWLVVTGRSWKHLKQGE